MTIGDRFRTGRLLLSVAAAVLLGAGCDGRPSGPGSYAGTVEGATDSPGAVLLQLTGEGIRAVEGEGGTRSWSAPVPGEAAELRVLLVDPDPSGSLTFRIEVDDLSRGPPAVTLLQAADRENRRIPVDDGPRVRLIR